MQMLLKYQALCLFLLRKYTPAVKEGYRGLWLMGAGLDQNDVIIFVF